MASESHRPRDLSPAEFLADIEVAVTNRTPDPFNPGPSTPSRMALRTRRPSHSAQRRTEASPEWWSDPVRKLHDRQPKRE